MVNNHLIYFLRLGSISEVTLGGAISVSTHGSGIKHGTLSSYVTELEMITSSGDLIKCSKTEKKEIFYAAVCGLGALGVIINVTIQCEPAFLLHEQNFPSTLDDVSNQQNVIIFLSTVYSFLRF